MTGKFDHLRSFAEAKAAFDATKPTILINHDPTIPEDVKLANQIMEALRPTDNTEKERVFSYDYFLKEMLNGGQDWRLETRKMARRADVVIDVWSVARTQGEGFQETIRKIALEDSDELGEGKTRLFPVVGQESDIKKVLAEVDGELHFGSWDSEESKKNLVVGMLTCGPKGRRKIGKDGGSPIETKRHTPRIEWERLTDHADFLRMLDEDATVQDMADIFPEVAKAGRYGKLVIVHEAEGTYHEKPISQAYVMRQVEQHSQEKKTAPGVVCSCKCGVERLSFSLDKPSADSTGVVIISDKPCTSCGSTALVNPIPGNTLRDVLDNHFAPKQ